MRTLRTAFLATAACLGVLSGALPRAEAADMKLLRSGSVIIDGEIAEGDSLRLLDALIVQAKRGLKTDRIFLNSPGGEVLAGAKVAEVIHKTGIAVVVGKGRMCASICVLMLSAGKERWAYSDARLGVHSVGTYGANASAPAPEDGSDRNFTLLVARLMKFYGAPDSVVVKLIVTKPNAIASLTGDDVAGWLNIAQ